MQSEKESKKACLQTLRREWYSLALYLSPSRSLVCVRVENQMKVGQIFRCLKLTVYAHILPLLLFIFVRFIFVPFWLGRKRFFDMVAKRINEVYIWWKFSVYSVVCNIQAALNSVKNIAMSTYKKNVYATFCALFSLILFIPLLSHSPQWE